MHPCVYLLENVPPLKDSQPIIVVGWQKIKAWIGEPIQVDATSIGSRAHRFWWIWTNITPLKGIQ
jgi:hypothetical protein